MTGKVRPFFDVEVFDMCYPCANCGGCEKSEKIKDCSACPFCGYVNPLESSICEGCGFVFPPLPGVAVVNEIK